MDYRISPLTSAVTLLVLLMHICALAYGKFDRSLRYASPNGRSTLSAYVLNIRNRIVKTTDITGSGTIYSDFMPPRTAGARVTYNF